MKCSHCINTRSVIGSNIPLDLHLEHLNCHFKNIISNLQPNATSKVITCTPRLIGLVHNIWQTLEQQNGAIKQSGKHARPSSKKECQIISEQLEEQKALYIHWTGLDWTTGFSLKSRAYRYTYHQL